MVTMVCVPLAQTLAPTRERSSNNLDRPVFRVKRYWRVRIVAFCLHKALSRHVEFVFPRSLGCNDLPFGTFKAEGIAWTLDYARTALDAPIRPLAWWQPADLHLT